MILIQKYTKETRNRIYLIQECTQIQKKLFLLNKEIHTGKATGFPEYKSVQRYVQYTVYLEYICKHTKLQKIGIHSWLLATYPLKYAKVELLDLREIR